MCRRHSLCSSTSPTRRPRPFRPSVPSPERSLTGGTTLTKRTEACCLISSTSSVASMAGRAVLAPVSMRLCVVAGGSLLPA
eukprot:jgi/Chrpa1/323/Chrysochromulina_OHIO_Genome00004760-RA